MPKSDQYLLIQNHGEAPVAGYTVLGYSGTRDSDVPGTIGQFGSGTKHAINLCLRNGLAVWVYCGNTRLEFALEKEIVEEPGLGTQKEVSHVIVKEGGKKFRRVGWALDFGVLDWDDIGMAVREFISNAIDRTIREEGRDVTDARNAGRLSIKIVDENERRAKAEYTRIYVAVNEEIRQYFGNLGKHFLHFSDNPESAVPGLLSKADRNFSDSRTAVVYREGVFVRELRSEAPSLYDYNFSKDEIKIDECRNSSDYAVRAACARKLGSADAATLSSIFRSQLVGVPTFEEGLDQDYVFGYYAASPSETQEEVWARAWEAAAGPDAVVVENDVTYNYVEKKGYRPKSVTSGWAKSLKKAGVKTSDDVLNADEQRGRDLLPATPDAERAVDWAWDIFEICGLTGEREKPSVGCFRELSKAGGHLMGTVTNDGVIINTDIANDGQNNELKKTAIEEVAHWITGATDNSRDFQNFFIDAIVAIA